MPKGCSTAISLGTPVENVSSCIDDIVTVDIPDNSISLCTSPTDQQQTGQAGIKTTASTFSSFSLFIIWGTVFFISSSGLRMYPMNE